MATLFISLESGIWFGLYGFLVKNFFKACLCLSIIFNIVFIFLVAYRTSCICRAIKRLHC